MDIPSDGNPLDSQPKHTADSTGVVQTTFVSIDGAAALDRDTVEETDKHIFDVQVSDEAAWLVYEHRTLPLGRHFEINVARWRSGLAQPGIKNSPSELARVIDAAAALVPQLQSELLMVVSDPILAHEEVTDCKRPPAGLPLTAAELEMVQHYEDAWYCPTALIEYLSRRLARKLDTLDHADRIAVARSVRVILQHAAPLIRAIGSLLNSTPKH